MKSNNSLKRTREQELASVNHYVASGNARGRLQSEATEFRGDVGYFFVGPVWVGKIKREAIMFSSIRGDDILSRLVD